MASEIIFKITRNDDRSYDASIVNIGEELDPSEAYYIMAICIEATRRAMRQLLLDSIGETDDAAAGAVRPGRN